MDQANKYSGFTLMEVILYVGIITMVLGAMLPFAWNVIGGGAKSAVWQEVYENSRLVAEKIRYEIRNASGITTVLPGSLTLANFPPDTSTVIEVVGGKVRINKNGTGAVNLSSDGVSVSGLVFTDNRSADGLTENISFVLTLGSVGVRQEYKAETVVRSSAELRSN